MKKHKYELVEVKDRLLDEWVEGGHSTRRVYSYKLKNKRKCDGTLHTWSQGEASRFSKCKKCYKKRNKT